MIEERCEEAGADSTETQAAVLDVHGRDLLRRPRAVVLGGVDAARLPDARCRRTEVRELALEAVHN